MEYKLDLKEKRIFVTGGSGFIGTALCRRLIESGADLLCLNHENPVKYGERIFGDVQHLGMFCGQAIVDFDPHYIFHLAAMPIVTDVAENPYDAMDTNVTGTIEVLRLASKIKSLQSMIHVSTDKVYGNLASINELSPLNGTTHPYNATKHASEILLQCMGKFSRFPIKIVRHANVYGPGDYHEERIVPNTLNRLLSGKSPIIRGDGTARRDYIYIDDLVGAYLRILDCPSPKFPDIFLLGGECLTVLDVVHYAQEVTGKLDVEIEYQDMQRGEIPNQHILAINSETRLEWKPEVSFLEGIKRTAMWWSGELDGRD